MKIRVGHTLLTVAAISLARLGALGKVLPIAKSDFQQVTRNEWAKPFQVQEQLKFNYHGK
jgi:hypothetical protein